MRIDHRLPDGRIPVLLTAATAELLHTDAAALLGYLEDHPQVPVAAIADQLLRTRGPRRHRALVAAADRAGLAAGLRALLDGTGHPAVQTGVAGDGGTALVFPGQGAQRPGMGRLFYDSSPAYRAAADEVAAAFAACGIDPLGYLLDADTPDTGAATLVQPALFTQLVGLAALWRSHGVTPAAVIGHSQGEIAAACVAGAVPLADAVQAVAARAAAVDAATGADVAMALVAAGTEQCAALLARRTGWAELSVFNSPGLTGISGDRATVAAIVDELDAAGVFARLLRVGYPAHTSWINPLRAAVTEPLAALSAPVFADTAIGCFGGTLGGPIDAGLPVADYWFLNLRNPVRFDAALAAAVTAGASTLVELAEHPTLQLAIEENPAAAAATVAGTSRRDATDLSVFTDNLIRVALHTADFDFAVLAGGEAAVPPLPDFPNAAMTAVSLWLPYDGDRPRDFRAADPAPAAPAAPAATAPVPGTPAVPADAAVGAPRLLAERWVRLTRRSMAAPHPLAIIADDATAALAEALGAAVADLGTTATVVAPGAPVGDATPVLLVATDPTADPAGAAATVAKFFTDRPFAAALSGGAAQCWLVTVGAEPVEPEAPVDPAAAGIAAGWRSVGVEYPGVALRHLDLPAGPVAAAAVAAALHTAGETELALRESGLHVKRVVPAPAAPPPAAAPRHALILGGTGNLGLEFAEHLAAAGTPRITLVSRSGATPAARQRLDRVTAATGAGIDVLRCDITDAAAVAESAARLTDAPVDLLVHAAMAYRDLDSAEVTAEAATALLATKVVGAQLVLDAVARTADCRVLLCSSAAATIGGRGQVLYAAANRMLDALALRWRAAGIDAASVQWGQWTTLDLSAAGWAKLTATGLLAMRPADALAVGFNGAPGNSIVAAFDLPRVRAVLGGFGYGPLLSELTDPDGAVPAAAAPAAAAPAPADAGAHLLHLLASAIGVTGPEAIDVDTPMVAIGLDSLQALEFRRRVKAELDHDLEVAELLGGASVADVLRQVRAG